MQNRWISMVLIASVAMNAAFVAIAGYGYFHNRSLLCSRMGRPFDKDHHFFEVLALTPTQLQKITPLAESFHAQLNRLHAEMGIKKEAMLGVLRDETAADDRIEALRREMAAIQERIQKTVIAHIFDVKAILDAAQQERFFSMLRDSMIEERPMFIPPGEK